MAEPDSTPWWAAFFAWLGKTIKDNWSGFAVLFYNYEEKKIDAAKQEQKTAELKEKLAANENEIRKIYSGQSDADILKEFGSKPSDDTDTN